MKISDGDIGLISGRLDINSYPRSQWQPLRGENYGIIAQVQFESRVILFTFKVFCLYLLGQMTTGRNKFRARSCGIFRNKNYGYSAPRAGMELSRYSGMQIAPKQMLARIIPIILIPD